MTQRYNRRSSRTSSVKKQSHWLKFLHHFQNDLVAVGVLSGNRNFEGRIHPLTRANYLASPPLVIAYALAGTVCIDFETEPLGMCPGFSAAEIIDIKIVNSEYFLLSVTQVCSVFFWHSQQGSKYFWIDPHNYIWCDYIAIHVIMWLFFALFQVIILKANLCSWGISGPPERKSRSVQHNEF